MPKTTSSSHVNNYITSNHFYIEIGSSIVACFSECSELGVQIQKDVYFEGGVNDQQRITLGHAEFTDVTLKRGITDDPTFTQWLGEVFEQKNKRRNVNILVFNQAGELMKSWTLIGSIPVGWKTSTLQADGNSVAIEELTLAIEGLKVGKSSAGGESASRDASGFFASSSWK
ncbi:phage tail protein [Chroococcidiopsis sp.]|uniref:phage tail protein n=1 Tax=Chroococcidiopsis sp. TaxID=3088168 RepID=UPI000B736405|nr:phage tail protein [cyanobacterium TDX16]